VHATDALGRAVAERETVVELKRAELADAEQALALAKTEHSRSEARLVLLVMAGTCCSMGSPSCKHGHAPTKSNEIAPGGSDAPAKPKPVVALDDATVPIKYRIASMLLADPVLDYQRTAAAIWGPLEKKVAKNRVNAQMQTLRRDGIVRTLGSNEFSVDRDRLLEKSGIGRRPAGCGN